MRRIIVTLCSLAISVAGTLGVNQLSSNNSDNNNTNIDNTVALQYAEEAKEQLNTTDESQPDVDTEVSVAVADIEEVVAPSNIKAEDAKANKNSSANTQSAVKNPQKVAQNTEANKPQTAVQKTEANKPQAKVQNTVANKPQTTVQSTVANKPQATVQNTEANKPQTMVQSPVANKPQTTVQNTESNTIKKSQNGQSLVFNNIDLTQCNSTAEVVKVLQNNGYRNINIGNIQQNSSLKDILAIINGTGNTGTAAPTPTTKPVQPAPAPTTKPVQTAPAPTTKPVQPAPAPIEAPVNKNSGIGSYANQVLQLVNQERAKAGLSALTTNATLQAAADKRAQETVQSFSHTRPNGTSFSTVLKEFGISYRTSGENIAYGQRTPQEVVTAWMNSPGHRANILGSSFGKIGIGVYQKNGVIYWSQLFTN